MTTILLYIRTICDLLWKSITSIDFYTDVREKYRGYGVKYIATLCFFGSILYSASLLYQMSTMKDELIASSNSYIEHILRQIPEMKYNGNIITANDETPVFIKDDDNRDIIVIDLKGDLSFTEKAKIPLVFTKSNVIFNFLNKSEKHQEITIAYKNFLGSEPLAITGSAVKDGLIKVLSSNIMFNIFIIPILSVLYFLQIMFKIIVPVGIVYFGLIIYGLSTELKTAIRLVIFASSAFVVLNVCLMLLLPEFIIFADLINVLSGFLLVMSLVREKNKKWRALKDSNL